MVKYKNRQNKNKQFFLRPNFLNTVCFKLRTQLILGDSLKMRMAKQIMKIIWNTKFSPYINFYTLFHFKSRSKVKEYD